MVFPTWIPFPRARSARSPGMTAEFYAETLKLTNSPFLAFAGDSSSTISGATASGLGKVSVLMGAITWSGSSNVSGAIEGGAPSPATYAFDWKNNRKGGTINMGFKNRSAAEVAVVPPPDPHPDLVPLTPAHKSGVLDPVSALLMLTKADGRPPCDRRVGIFCLGQQQAA